MRMFKDVEWCKAQFHQISKAKRGQYLDDTPNLHYLCYDSEDIVENRTVKNKFKIALYSTADTTFSSLQMGGISFNKPPSVDTKKNN